MQQANEIMKTNGQTILPEPAVIDRFTARINEAPNPTEMKKDPKGFDYLPASFMQMELDEIFLGLWSWEVRSIQVVANEILIQGDLRVFHPITGQWIVRSGVGAAIIRQKKDSAITDIDGKIKDAITMDLPHAETDAFKNAAKKLGKRFGRDLNRKFVDEYDRQVLSEEEQKVERDAAEYKKLHEQVRLALAVCLDADLKARVRNTLNEKKAEGLTADDLRQAIDELKNKKA